MIFFYKESKSTKKKEGGRVGGRGRGLEQVNFYYSESKSRIKKNLRGWVGGFRGGMGLEKVNFFYFEPKFKIEFFSGGEGGGARASYFFYRESIFFCGGGGGGGGAARGTGWRTGVGGWTDEQAQAFKCDLGLQPR